MCQSENDSGPSKNMAERQPSLKSLSALYLDATVSIGPSLCSVTDGPYFLSN